MTILIVDDDKVTGTVIASPLQTPKRPGYTGIADLTQNFRYHILDPNQIYIDDNEIDDDAWRKIAFSIGLSTRDSKRITSETPKLANRMARRSGYSADQVNEIITPFLSDIITRHSRISTSRSSRYFYDAVPTLENLKNTVRRLPSPRPAFSCGYRRVCFTAAQHEIQSGIIVDTNGDPCDLNQVSQPCHNHYWPFFVVEISDDSVAQAKQLCAISGATCNNAVKLVSAASMLPGWDERSWDADNRNTRTFSLAVHDNLAHLNTHGMTLSGSHITTTIGHYRLHIEDDVARLADKIHSVLIWGQYTRLAEIVTTLDRLDVKVRNKLSGTTTYDSPYEFDPSTLANLIITDDDGPLSPALWFRPPASESMDSNVICFG